MANLDGKPLTEPRPIRFVTGRRKLLWNRNVVCMGLASGFLEPLESTSIHLIQVAIQRLILLFPHHGDNEERRREFNRSAAAEVRVHPRLHHPALLRPTTGRVSRSGTLAATCRSRIHCARRIELFRETAGIFCAPDDLFQLTSWLQVLWGQGVRPRATHPFVEAIAPQDRAGYLQDLRRLLAQAAGQVPDHAAFIAKHCAAAPPRT